MAGRRQFLSVFGQFSLQAANFFLSRYQALLLALILLKVWTELLDFSLRASPQGQGVPLLSAPVKRGYSPFDQTAAYKQTYKKATLQFHMIFPYKTGCLSIFYQDVGESSTCRLSIHRTAQGLYLPG